MAPDAVLTIEPGKIANIAGFDGDIASLWLAGQRAATADERQDGSEDNES
jgi:hypothetical protein